jgi:cytochrome c
MKSIPLAFAAALALGAAGAYAQADAVLKSKGCLGCHDFEKKKVGPAFKDIAAKHRGDAKAEAMLVAKLKDGKGHMKIKASEDEIRMAVEKVLAAK